MQAVVFGQEIIGQDEIELSAGEGSFEFSAVGNEDEISFDAILFEKGLYQFGEIPLIFEMQYPNSLVHFIGNFPRRVA